MRKTPFVLCTLVLAGACVNLDKPENVAECAAAGTCSSPRRDGGAKETPSSDGLRPGDGSADGQNPGDGTDAAGPSPDGAGGDTALPVFDGSEPSDGGPAPDGEQPAQPDGSGNTPADVPQVPPDAIGYDAVSRDVSPGICGSNGALKPAGTPCRPAVGPCDIAETCDGANVDCPIDKLAPVGKECRPAAAGCDIAETCNGSSADCPVDQFTQSGTVCREAAGPCDHAEICSGTSAECPSDSLRPSSTECRATTNPCDPPESCTGLGASCPPDVPAYPRPTAPTTVTATPGELQATITWSAVAGATAYNVKRSTKAGGPYTTIATAVATTSYLDKGLDSNNTYYYVVSAINSILSCVSQGDSPEAAVKPTGVCIKPGTPLVTAAAGNGRVTLTWAAISGATAYAVDRSETSSTGYASLASVPGTSTSYVDTAVVVGTTYYYRVTAKAACDSDASAEVSAVPVCTPAAAAPTALVAATPNTGGLVVLSWTAVAGAKSTDRYYIMRKPSAAATYTRIDEVAPPTTTYNDTSAANGTSYGYAVAYYNGTCTSSNSNAVTATPACVMDKPVLTLTPGNGKVDLSWTAPANGSLSGFQVYRKDVGSYALVTSLTGASSTTYTDSGLTNDTAYTYYVTAVGNCDADSAPVAATPHCTPLPAPTNLQASASDGQVTLSWDVVTGADHYTVKRGDATGGPYTALVPALPIKTNSATDTGLTNGVTYFYVVTASNGSCDSVNSNEASATPQTCASQGAPGTPTLAVTPSTQVKIDWTAATPVPSGGYNVLRSTSAAGPYTSVGSTNGSTLSFTDPTEAPVDTTYFYRVTAIGGSCGNTSPASSIALVCSTPAAPVPSLTTNANGSITIAWTEVNGATAYTVARKTGSDADYAPLPDATNLTATSFIDADVVNATQYSYVVTASNAHQQCVSPRSSPVSGRACIIPNAPQNVLARRSGNKQVTVAWTNSQNGKLYTVLRNGTSVATTSGSPAVDATATNTSSFNYVVTAASDANCPASSNSAQVSVPSCTVLTGGGSQQKQNDTSEWCIVTCDDVGWWSDSGLGDRTLYINTVQTNTSGAMPLPAKGNGGYAFYFTAGSGNYTYWNYSSSANHACP